MKLQVVLTIADRLDVVEQFKSYYENNFGPTDRASPNQWLKLAIEEIVHTETIGRVDLRKYDVRVESEWLDANDQQVDVYILNTLGVKP